MWVLTPVSVALDIALFPLELIVAVVLSRDFDVTVTDEAGSPVAGARVYANRKFGGAERLTNEDGVASLAGISFGLGLAVQKDGFHSVSLFRRERRVLLVRKTEEDVAELERLLGAPFVAADTARRFRFSAENQSDKAAQAEGSERDVWIVQRDANRRAAARLSGLGATATEETLAALLGEQRRRRDEEVRAGLKALGPTLVGPAQGTVEAKLRELAEVAEDVNQTITSIRADLQWHQERRLGKLARAKVRPQER